MNCGNVNRGLCSRQLKEKQIITNEPRRLKIEPVHVKGKRLFVFLLHQDLIIKVNR